MALCSKFEVICAEPAYHLQVFTTDGNSEFHYSRSWSLNWIMVDGMKSEVQFYLAMQPMFLELMLWVVQSISREWMVDLLVKPGQITNPDSRLAAPPAVIASPLQFERPSIFNGSNVTVNHWARGESGGAKIGNTSNASKASKSTSGNNIAGAMVPVKTAPFDPDKGAAPVRSPRAQNYPNTWRGGIPSPRGPAPPQPFDFTPQLFDPSSISQIAKERELEKENSQPRDRDQQYQGSQKSQNQDGHRGIFSGDISDNDGSGWPNDKGSSSGQEDNNFRRARLGEFAREFEILWEDLAVGDRIGQGMLLLL